MNQTSRSKGKADLENHTVVPIQPSSAALEPFYTSVLNRASAETAIAAISSTINGVPGFLFQAHLGSLDLKIFSINSNIPWSLVTNSATRLRSTARTGFTVNRSVLLIELSTELLTICRGCTTCGNALGNASLAFYLINKRLQVHTLYRSNNHRDSDGCRNSDS